MIPIGERQREYNVPFKYTPGKVPLFDATISAGFPSPAADYYHEDITADELLGLGPAVFLARVNGDSMEGAKIFHKSIIVIDRAEKAGHNKIVVGVLNREFTVKRLVQTRAGWVLHPENPMYKPYLLQESDEFEVWGVVKMVLNKAE